jgi:multimeric flavodoxin WrbA
MAEPRHLLVVYHSRSGSTARLLSAVLEGVAAGASESAVARRCLAAPDADADDVRWADSMILGTPANFGYMSGLMKDFLERVYHPSLEVTAGLPYALFVKGDTDVDGAVASVERIVAGLKWRAVTPHLVVVGDVGDSQLAAAFELGATMAAGLEARLW